MPGDTEDKESSPLHREKPRSGEAESHQKLLFAEGAVRDISTKAGSVFRSLLTMSAV